MLMHQNQQSNPSAIISSYLPQNTPNIPDIKVIYRTQEEIERLETIRYTILQHKKSRRRLAAGVLLKIIGWREMEGERGECVTRQEKFGSELHQFGYDKNITARQIKRVMASLVKHGLIRCERSYKYNYRSVYRCETTSLGRDAYFLYIKNNEGPIQIKTLDLPTKSVDNDCITQKNCGTEIKMAPRNPLNLVKNESKSVQFQKNGTSNININIHKRNININMGCSKIEQITNHIFSFFHEPYLEPGEKLMRTPKDWAKNGLARQAHEVTLDLLCNKEMSEDEHRSKYDELFFKQLAKIQRKRKREEKT